MFGIAMTLAVLVPVLITIAAVVRERGRPAVLPVDRARATGAVVAASPLRFDFWSGFSTGFLASFLLPPIAGVVAGRAGAPAWSDQVAIGVLVLAPLLLHVALRPRGRYALGMSAGAAVVGVAAPLVSIALFAAADLLAGWR